MGWIRNLRQRVQGGQASFAPPAPEAPLYIIGDIHGMAARLEALLDRIDAHIGASGAANPRLVFVGDYVDRGDHSAQVVARVRELTAQMPDNVICLLGNHEKMLLDFLDRPRERGGRWLRNGGLQTLASFGVRGMVTENTPGEALEELAHAFRKSLPDGAEAWLRALPLYWQSGTVAVVHAAADPKLAIDAQSDRVLLWGMSDFFKTPRTDGLWVVHGHTVVDTAEAKAGRIAVDTGAVFGGDLTAVVIAPGREMEFLRA